MECPRLARGSSTPRSGFTLVELLIVLLILSLLLILIFPVFKMARDTGETLKCAANLRVLGNANIMYADDNDGWYVPAHDNYRKDLKRWFGERSAEDEPFDPTRGPLKSYFGTGGVITPCPSLKQLLGSAETLEGGCGGYGYNAMYIGSSLGPTPKDPNARRQPARNTDVIGKKIMFADAASVADPKIPDPPPDPLPLPYLVAYPFLDPPLSVTRPEGGTELIDPSIHFRHLGRVANVCFVDGHVESIPFGFSKDAKFERLNVGWIGANEEIALRYFIRK